MAFDPAYAKTHRFYVDYTDRNGDTRVVEYRSDGEAAIPSSARQLLFVKDFACNHNGGQLQFGPDGLLYWGNGDGGGGGDPEHNGQNLNRPFAKIMRLDVNAAEAALAAHRLRPAQPLALLVRPRDAATSTSAMSARTPGRRSTTCGTAFRTPVNFGWNRFEGTHIYDGSTALLTRGPLRRPRVRVPPRRRLFGDRRLCLPRQGVGCCGRPLLLRRLLLRHHLELRIANGKAAGVRRESITLQGLSSFGEGTDGELYVMSVESGGLYRLAP